MSKKYYELSSVSELSYVTNEVHFVLVAVFDVVGTCVNSGSFDV